MSKITAIVLIIIALIVGAFAGFMVERARATATMETYKMQMQKNMDATMKMEEDKMMKDQKMEDDKMMQASPEPTGMMMHTTVSPTGEMMKK